MGSRRRKKVIESYCPKARLMPSRAIEPYYFKNAWSRNLAGKTILVIHPFAQTIQKQFKNRTSIFTNVLPENMKLETIRAIQSNAGGHVDFQSWFEALEYMKKEIDQIDFDVSIIGAGAYGLPLTAYCKKIGKQAIQMSGATQILFGIKGRRWDSIPEISAFYNDYWVRPSQEETPPQIEKVEGGSYW